MRPRILTGDTPTGRLHLGHWVGSLENRVRLQDEYECFFLIANMHAFTTRAEKPEEIRRDTIEIVKDWLAVGMDPERSTFVLQTEVPAIAELTWLLAMLLPFNRVMRNPTLKEEIEAKQLGDHYSFGFPLYAVGQCADILAFRADLVPVGEDQLAHLEMCREVARRFDHLYCGVPTTTEDADYARAGGVFPVPQPKVGRIARLVGIDGVQKMSKSLGNAIFLSDEAGEIKKKTGKIFTGRQSATDPGDIKNALFQFVNAFIADPERRRELAELYTRGEVGDGTVKQEVSQAIDALVAPMRERRRAYDGPAGEARIVELLHAHAAKANAVAEDTLARAKAAMKLDFGARTLMFVP
ncbi:MAG: tryptophan--tRNA ligase [Myxococcales bacterium]|nr:tryptophan--tRNA ligase [Myxococcales bacterium]